MRSGKMTQGLAGVLSLIGLFAGMSGAASAADFKSGELIVKYKDDVARSRVEMNALYNAAGVKRVKHLGGIMKGLDQVILSESVKLQDAIAAFESSPSVEFAQPNYILHAFPTSSVDDRRPEDGGIPCIPGFDIPGCGGGGGGGGTIPCIPGFEIPGCGGGNNPTPPPANPSPIPCLFPGIPFPPGCQDDGGNPSNPTNPPTTRPELAPAPADVIPAVADPDLGKAYGLGKIAAPEAWEKVTRGSKSIIVADIDTGIDYNHEDLAFNLWRGQDPQTGKEFVGYDFVHNDNLPFDDNEHGTHTAGTIGAVGGNGKGVSGVAQRVSIMALKFLSSEGSGTTADAIKAIDFAISHGAKILSNSWGGEGDEDNKALKEAIERARQRDVLFIAAAGNAGKNNDDPKQASYPAGFDNDNLIAVAATDSRDNMAFFSNYGKKTTHLAAPGVDIYSTVPGGKYKKESGTSMACPHVAGAAALLWSKHPEWNYKKVKEVLLSSTDPVAGLAEKTVTGGRLNVLKALQAAQ